MTINDGISRLKGVVNDAEFKLSYSSTSKSISRRPRRKEFPTAIPYIIETTMSNRICADINHLVKKKNVSTNIYNFLETDIQHEMNYGAPRIPRMLRPKPEECR